MISLAHFGYVQNPTLKGRIDCNCIGVGINSDFRNTGPGEQDLLPIHCLQKLFFLNWDGTLPERLP